MQREASGTFEPVLTLDDHYLSGLLELLELRMEEELGLGEPHCYFFASCEANSNGTRHSFNTVGDATRELFRYTEGPGSNLGYIQFKFYCLASTTTT